MEFTGKLTPQDWMTVPETTAVMAALMAGGADVRFVGGCVRDAMLKRPVSDIDIATPEKPETVLQRLQDADIKAIPTGIDHGTITAVIGKKHFEITTLRIDAETFGRHARVAYTDSWEADAARRDFTINTLSSTPDGDVYDPFNGIHDISYGRVKFVGIARERIEEDILRLLRYFRFFATYSRPPADTAALAACRAMAPRLKELSGERLGAETLKILLAPNPADTAVLMRGERVLDEILPESGDVGRLRMLYWLETSAIHMEAITPNAIRRLAALVDPAHGGDTATEVATAIAQRLRLSNDQRHRLAFMLAPPDAVSPDGSARDLRHALNRHGADRVRDAALITWAGELAITPKLPRERTEAWIGILQAADDWEPIEFPLQGRDVMALGVSHGPQVGHLLADVREWWEDGDYQANRDACLEKLSTLVGGAR